MTGYTLFRKAYLHYMGYFMARMLNYVEPRAYALKSLEDDLGGYNIHVEGNCSVLTFEYEDADKYQLNLELLQGIVVPSGYYLCHYSGHTGSWLMLYCADKDEAHKTYRRLFQRYFRKEIFMCTVKV